MTVEWTDLLGILSVACYLAGVGAVTSMVWMLMWRQGYGRALVVALIVTAALYVGAVALDAPSVVTVLKNGVGDIPPASAGRTVLAAVWAWLIYAALLTLYRRPVR